MRLRSCPLHPQLPPALQVLLVLLTAPTALACHPIPASNREQWITDACLGIDNDQRGVSALVVRPECEAVVGSGGCAFTVDQSRRWMCCTRHKRLRARSV